MKSNYLRHFVTACICLSAVLGLENGRRTVGCC
jgi:hypothetical protein